MHRNPHGRFDLRLVAVSQRLVPMIRESFQQVKEEITQRAIAEAQAANSGAAGTIEPEGPAAVDPKRAEKAEKFKVKGNEAYLAGRHADAVTEYSKAINTNPSVAVYYNNRAMACIRLFRFEQAEEDCCRALAFPDLSEKDKVHAAVAASRAWPCSACVEMCTMRSLSMLCCVPALETPSISTCLTDLSLNA